MPNWGTPYSVSDNAVKEHPVFVGLDGKPLIIRKPRVIGFRPPVKENNENPKRGISDNSTSGS